MHDVQQSQLLIWIALLPLIGAAINGALGKSLFKSGPIVHIVALVAMAGAAALTWVNFFALLGMDEHHRVLEQTAFTWIAVGGFQADFAFWFDPLSAVMALIITNVGFLIHLYSVGYMKGDQGYHRFFTYLNLFIFAMLCLVLGNNLLVLFLGWEGVGLCSYLLIGFWYENAEYASAGKKAFVVNRIGDVGFIIGMFLLFVAFGTIEPAAINAALAGGVPEGINIGFLNAAGICLFVGAMGKSAQIPLYVWLPDAMAGPTPVSALIHAATMVTAGVYMIARLNGLYATAEAASMMVLYVGAFTALFSATIGLVQNDIKKVLAYSTVSQLGFMFAAMGAGAYAIGVFHLMTHAFFKACLFLGSGSVIMAMWHSQDMRHYGGLRKYMPVTYVTFFVATLAISGFPLFAGFYSKDEILLYALGSDNSTAWLHVLPYIMLVAAAFCTCFYMFRIMYLTFWGEYRGVPEELMVHHSHYSDEHDDDHGHGHDDHHHDHAVDPASWRPKENGLAVTIPLMVLGLLSFVGGFVGLTKTTSFGVTETSLLHDWLHPVIAGTEAHLRPDIHAIEVWLMILSIGVAFSALGLAHYMYRVNTELPAKLATRFAFVHQLLMDKYRVDEFYDDTVIKPIQNGSTHFLWQIVDKILIDSAVMGVGSIAKIVASVFGWFQTGDTQRYAVWMVAGVILVVGVYFGSSLGFGG